MNYTQLDQATHNQDRVCIYFKLDLLNGTSYAAKQSVDGVITSVKELKLIEAISWVGFGELGQALLNAPKFSKKFKTKLFSIIPNSLLVLRIMGEFFYITKNDGQWHPHSSIKGNPFLEKEETQQDITQIMGRDFIQQQEDQLKREETLNNNLRSTFKEMRQLNKSIAEGNIKSTPAASEELPVIDINESQCSVIFD